VREYIPGFNLLFLALSPLSPRGLQRKSERNFGKLLAGKLVGKACGDWAVEFQRDPMMVKF